MKHTKWRSRSPVKKSSTWKGSTVAISGSTSYSTLGCSVSRHLSIRIATQSCQTFQGEAGWAQTENPFARPTTWLTIEKRREPHPERPRTRCKSSSKARQKTHALLAAHTAASLGGALGLGTPEFPCLWINWHAVIIGLNQQRFQVRRLQEKIWRALSCGSLMLQEFTEPFIVVSLR